MSDWGSTPAVDSNFGANFNKIYCYYINSRSATAAFDVSDYKTEHYCALTLSAIDPRRVFIGGKLSFVL